METELDGDVDQFDKLDYTEHWCHIACIALRVKITMFHLDDTSCLVYNPLLLPDSYTTETVNGSVVRKHSKLIIAHIPGHFYCLDSDIQKVKNANY